MATLEVEIFKCERYRPLAGWSSDFLLPTDSHAYRMKGKKGGWSKLTEAEAALLGLGWDWEEALGPAGEPIAWEVSAGTQHTDPDGWLYGTNFTSTYEGSAKSGMQMFTRWRRLVRTQTFKGIETLAHAVQPGVLAGRCLNVDLEYAEQVGRLLLESLSAASLHGDWCFSALIKLKCDLLERLVRGKGDTLEGVLANLVNAQKGLTSMFKGKDDAQLRTRMAEVDKQFPRTEREAFSVLAIHRFRPDQACSEGATEHECPFRAVLCSHKGCTERFSAKSVESHDRTCGWKQVLCEKCNEKIPRRELRGHLAAACPMREATCNFQSIGCNATLTQRDVHTHLEECTQAHILLLLQTITEQQTAIRSLTAKVGELESSHQKLETAHGAQVTVAAAQADVVARVGALEQKLAALEKSVRGDVTKVSKDVTAAVSESNKRTDAVAQESRKRTDSAISGVRSEIEALRADIGGTRTSIKELDKKIEPLVSKTKG